MKKKLLKIIAATLMTVILVTVLCSCNSLERIKKHHAVYEDESHKAIIYNEEKYVLYEENDSYELFERAVLHRVDDIFAFQDYDKDFVTESDVPDLISDAVESEEINVSADKKIIQVEKKDDADDPNGWSNAIYLFHTDTYILEKEFESIVSEYKRLRYDPQYFCCGVSNYKPDAFSMTDETVTKGILNALKNEPVKLNFEISKKADASTIGTWGEADIYSCNKEASLALRFCQIHESGGEAESKYYVTMIHGSAENAYLLDESCNDAVESLLKRY